MKKKKNCNIISSTKTLNTFCTCALKVAVLLFNMLVLLQYLQNAIQSVPMADVWAKHGCAGTFATVLACVL